MPDPQFNQKKCNDGKDSEGKKNKEDNTSHTYSKFKQLGDQEPTQQHTCTLSLSYGKSRGLDTMTADVCNRPGT